MSYSQQRVLAIAVAVALATIGAASIGNQEILGISPRLAAWLAIVAVGLGSLQAFLPDVTGKAQKPEHIANRIMELSHPERMELLAEVEHRRTLESLDEEAPR